MKTFRFLSQLIVSLLVPGLLIFFTYPHIQAAGPDSFTFAVTADTRQFAGPDYNTPKYFRGVVEAIMAHGPGAFMVSPGDIDPPANIYWTITQTLGLTYPWYPVVGNHEAETLADMDWLRAYNYGTIKPGPAGCPTTTYSFDYGQAHFVVLNEYCDVMGDSVTDGDVPDHLYNWLVHDLDTTQQRYIFVIGHEPAYPQPDADNGRLRHETDSLNQYPTHRDRFWDLLRSRKVTAYICGHTHNYSAIKINGVWQLDVGHARGLGDTGARSTFSLIHVEGSVVTFETYRDNAKGGPYSLMHTGTLVGGPLYLPSILSATHQTRGVFACQSGANRTPLRGQESAATVEALITNSRVGNWARYVPGRAQDR